MPLRALRGDKNVCAFEYDHAGWLLLKGDYRASSLHMPCCRTPAVPKTSKLGNYFFAHARRGECKSAPESAEHIHLKTLIARAAAASGWTVSTEQPGATPTGKRWIADVFCERRTGKIALEAQLSRLSPAEINARQSKLRGQVLHCNIWQAWQASQHFARRSVIRHRRYAHWRRISGHA